MSSPCHNCGSENAESYALVQLEVFGITDCESVDYWLCCDCIEELEINEASNSNICYAGGNDDN